MSFFHISGAMLQPGAIIMPGNWGRIIRLFGWQHNRSVFEVALADQRQENFPQLPSRLDCSFFFDDLDEARFYKTNQNLLTHILYEVQVLDVDVPQHRTDWRNISPNGALDNDWTRRYWAPVFQPPALQPSGQALACREVLAVSPLKVLAVVP
jgi:hypothetical protein